jgi:hypothetical protein
VLLVSIDFCLNLEPVFLSWLDKRISPRIVHLDLNSNETNHALVPKKLVKRDSNSFHATSLGPKRTFCQMKLGGFVHITSAIVMNLDLVIYTVQGTDL